MRAGIDWYVIRTRPTFEEVTADWIENAMRGEAWYPVAKRMPRNKDRGLITVEVSVVFHGYVLARFENAPNWRDLDVLRTATPRLYTVYSHDEIVDQNTGRTMPVYVPFCFKDEDVTDLTLRQARGEFDQLGDGENPIIKKLIGTKIKIPSGPFYGYIGKVKSIADGIVVVSVRILGKSSHLSFTCDTLFASLGIAP